jgi:general secretion pathway protein F
MSAYEYVALDQRGRKTKGIIEGETPRQARQLLREQGKNVVSLESFVEKKGPDYRKAIPGRRISVRDLALFTRQLAILIRSGLPLEEALAIASEQTDKRHIRKIIMSLRARILEGRTLAHACRQHPSSFPTLYHATVSAGESSGKLDNVLENLSDYLDVREAINRKTQTALIYPVLLTFISVLIVIGLLTFVVPQIAGVFDNIGQELPTLTRWLIQASEFMTQHGLLLLLFAVAVTLLLRLLLKIGRVRYRFHKGLLSMPFAGRFIRGSNSARFTRTLSILTSSGVDLLKALEITKQVISNLPMKQAVEEAAVQVREGSSLSRALAKSKLFPSLTNHFIASGESSGELDRMLESAADYQEREIQSFSEMMLSIFEPVLIMVMGGIVLLIVISILLPIFEMNQLVS